MAAKNNYKGVCKKHLLQGLLPSPVGQPNYHDYIGQIKKNTLFQLISKGSHLTREKKTIHTGIAQIGCFQTPSFWAVLEPFYV